MYQLSPSVKIHMIELISLKVELTTDEVGVGMSDIKNKGQGFRIYNERERGFSSKSYKSMAEKSSPAENLSQHQQSMEINLLQKLHANTVVAGMLMYKDELKGVRFYDPNNRRFIDIAPWHLSRFNVSKLKLIGVRELELIRHEVGNSSGTLVVEFLTKHEVGGLFKANRMVSENLAIALSGIMNYMSDDEYNVVIASFANADKGE